MALSDILNKGEKPFKYFLLTLIDGTEMYIKSSDHSDSEAVIRHSESSILNLSQLNTERQRKPKSFQKGFILCAEEIDSKAISSNFNKLWEILK